MAGRIARWTTYGAGLVFVWIGLHGIFSDPRNTGPGGWIRWFVGGIVLHDVVFVPCVLVVAAVVSWVPLPYRRIIQVALIVGGSLTLVALPVVLGYGRRPDNPSQLPLDYGRNLALAWLVIVTLAVMAMAATFVSRKMRH
jgi:hypothetical protein